MLMILTVSISTLFPYTTLFRSYQRESYVFLRDSLDFTTKQQKKAKGTTVRHVSGPETCRTVVPFAFFCCLVVRSEEHTSELQSRGHLVCRLLLEKNNIYIED